MLCKKHIFEESNSSDCEFCGSEIKIKQLEAENELIRKTNKMLEDDNDKLRNQLYS